MPARGGLSRVELLQGTLDLIILQTLRWGPRHGYGIAQMIRATSREALRVETGSLYPALQRLEKQGGSRRTGTSPRTDSVFACTGSPPPAANSFSPSARAGSSSRAPSR